MSLENLFVGEGAAIDIDIDMFAKFSEQFDVIVAFNFEAARYERRRQPRAIELSNEHALGDICGFDFKTLLLQRNDPFKDAGSKASGSS